MSKTETIKANIEPGLKHEAEEILQQLGLSVSEAISLFYNQIRQNKGIPFKVKTPNATTQKTFRETDEGKNLVECENAEDMFNKLGI